MRGDKFTNIVVPDTATSDTLYRVRFDKKKYISAVVKNTSRSAQTLWVAVNSDDTFEPLEPGESFPIAARENSYLRGELVMRWDNQSDDRKGIVTLGIDDGEIKDC